MKKQQRLTALDAFRGITIAAMIIVNQPGNRKFMYNQMKHSSWNGCTITDLIFPFFLIIVGVAMWFTFQKKEIQTTGEFFKKVFRRTVIIFSIGIFLNLASQFFRGNGINLAEIRITGVLQRIALCYFFASIMCNYLSPKQILYSSVGILFGYWFALWYFGGEAPYAAETTIVGKIDIALLTESHLRHGYPVDSSGFFASIPAIVHVLWGYLIGMIISKSENQIKIVQKMLLIGVPAIILAKIWAIYFPLNKNLWSSSYVLYSTGWALIVLAAFIWIIDVKLKKKWTKPLLVFGVNPLFAYVFAQIWSMTMSSSMVYSMFSDSKYSLKRVLNNDILLPVFGDLNASLLYSIILMVFYWFILKIMYDNKIYIKI